jgi:hypothetical protein
VFLSVNKAFESLGRVEAAPASIPTD